VDIVYVCSIVRESSGGTVSHPLNRRPFPARKTEDCPWSTTCIGFLQSPPQPRTIGRVMQEFLSPPISTEERKKKTAHRMAETADGRFWQDIYQAPSGESMSNPRNGIPDAHSSTPTITFRINSCRGRKKTVLLTFRIAFRRKQGIENVLSTPLPAHCGRSSEVVLHRPWGALQHHPNELTEKNGRSLPRGFQAFRSFTWPREQDRKGTGQSASNNLRVSHNHHSSILEANLTESHSEQSRPLQITAHSPYHERTQIPLR